MNPHLRLATENDAHAMLAIYEPFIHDTAFTFELVSPSMDEFRRRIRDTIKQHPWLVCEDLEAGKIMGYAYAGKHHERAAYQWSANVSIYIAADQHRQGIGRKLYAALFRILAEQGYCNLYGGITLPNAPSVALHESFGFKPTALYKSVGFKFGDWHDVGYWHLLLRPLATPTAPPLTTYRL